MNKLLSTENNVPENCLKLDRWFQSFQSLFSLFVSPPIKIYPSNLQNAPLSTVIK